MTRADGYSHFKSVTVQILKMTRSTAPLIVLTRCPVVVWFLDERVAICGVCLTVNTAERVRGKAWQVVYERLRRILGLLDTHGSHRSSPIYLSTWNKLLVDAVLPLGQQGYSLGAAHSKGRQKGLTKLLKCISLSLV